MAKVDDYLAMAQIATERADASLLDNVRAQHEQSAAAWREMARSEQARADRRDEITLATARRVAGTAPQADAPHSTPAFSELSIGQRTEEIEQGSAQAEAEQD